MVGALDGIRIIDFGQYVAGPLAAMLLADQGADVVRVDPPGGPRWKTPANAVWNRGKRSVVLDLHEAADRAVARDLILSADVVVENFRPRVMTRLGLGAEEMTAASPALIYCSLPGFASDDPRADTPGWEGVVAAAAGTYLTEGRPEHPVYTAIPISSNYSAFIAVSSIAAALSSQERDGLGQRIEVPLFDATFTAAGVRGLRIHDRTQQPPPRGFAWVRQYQCADGRWVQFHAANTRFIEQFAKAAGIEDWREEGLLDRQRTANDPELGRLLQERMLALFRTRTAQEWEDIVNAAGTPTAVCRDTAEWLDHPHARTSRMIVEVAGPDGGQALQPGINPRLEGTPGSIRFPARPAGEDGDAVRAELGSRQRPTKRHLPVGPLRGALEGIKVLDLCIILAGPTCGRTLAEFGADVIKIDNPDREGGIGFHHDVNRGKRSLLLDLKRQEGRDVFWRLVEDADVVVQNYRAGAVERLGISYDEVRKRKPDIIYASLNAYGHDGPWEARPGWEQLAQAATGMQARFGGDGQPVLQPFPVNDYGTGIMGAYGVALALFHRQRTGEGQHVRAALAYTACTLQSLFFPAFAGKPWDEPRGQDCLGSGPLNRLYRASDEWFFLAGRPSSSKALARVEGLQGIEGAEEARLEAFLEERFSKAPALTWVARLTAAGFGAQRAATVTELMEDPWVVGHGLSITRHHDGTGLVRTNGPSPRLSRTPAVPGQPASAPGADARAVLQEYGLGSSYERLVGSGVVVVEGVPAR